MSTWYYAKNGQQLGPITADDLRAKVSSGEIALSDLIWREGMAAWEPASGVQELGLAYGVSPQPQPGYGVQQPPIGYPGAAPVGYPPPGAGYPPPGAPQQLGYGGYSGPGVPMQGQHNGKAVTAFVLSLVGLLICGIILEPVALIMGITTLNAMKKTGDEKGKGLAIAAIIIGAIGLVLGIVGFLVIMGNRF